MLRNMPAYLVEVPSPGGLLHLYGGPFICPKAPYYFSLRFASDGLRNSRIQLYCKADCMLYWSLCFRLKTGAIVHLVFI